MTGPEIRRVAWLVTTMGYGSQLLYWEPILSRLARLLPGLRVHLTPGKSIRPESRIPVIESIHTWRITRPAAGKSSYKRIITLINPAIIATVIRQRPDLIVISEFGLLSLYGLVAASFRRKTPVLLLVESDPGPVSRMRTALRKFIIRHVDMIMTNNTAGRQYLTKTLGTPASRIRQALYLVSRPDSLPGNTAEDTHHPESLRSHPYFNRAHTKFLYVGQIAARKGLNTLVEAVYRLSDKHRSRTCIAIVGSGDDNEILQLRALIEQRGLSDNFHFMGRVPYAELSHYYRSSDVFIFPTLNDYRALVGFEAISHGLPVLMSRYDGASTEVVQEGRNGYTFDPYNSEEFAEKLAWFIDHPERVTEMGLHSAKLSATLTPEIAAENLAACINECMTLAETTDRR